LAKEAYAGVYDGATIKKWLKEFFLRFFHNQFKRSCLPDGAKVGTVAISPTRRFADAERCLRR
jgi:NAD+ synthase (glutamine-hydrolysing)